MKKISKVTRCLVVDRFEYQLSWNDRKSVKVQTKLLAFSVCFSFKISKFFKLNGFLKLKVHTNRMIPKVTRYTCSMR